MSLQDREYERKHRMDHEPQRATPSRGKIVWIGLVLLIIFIIAIWPRTKH